MSVKSRSCCSACVAVALGVLLSLGAGEADAQALGFLAASIEPNPGVQVAGPGTLRVPVSIRIRRGYHINSDRPNEDYLIPTVLSWEGSPFPVEAVTYPPAEQVRYDFSDAPLSVFSSRIEIVTTFRVEDVPEALRELRGSLRFQACNDRACLPPRTIAVTVPVRR